MQVDEPNPDNLQMLPPTAGPRGQINRGHAIRTIAVCCVVVAVLVVAASYYLSSNRQGANAFVATPGGGNNGKASSSIASLLAPAQNQTLPSLLGIMLKGVEASKTFSISYSGNATVSMQGSSLLGNMQLKIPLVVSYSKYYNDSRIYLNASGIPLIGNMAIIQINDNGVRYSCSAGSGLLSGSSSTGFTCSNSSSNSSGASMQLSLPQQVGSLNGITSTLSVLGSSEYIGHNCTIVKMDGTVNPAAMGSNSSLSSVTEITSGNSIYAYSVSACLANDYFVPLHVDANMHTLNSSKSAMSMNLTLDATSLTTDVSQGSVVSLPGPIISSPASGLGNYNMTYNLSSGTYIITGNGISGSTIPVPPPPPSSPP